MNNKLKLCIPTLNRYDLCLKLIWTAELNTIKPEEYLIVDNGGNFKSYFEKSELQRLDNVRIHTPQKNLGVSGSWNWFLKNTEDTYLLISNDDLIIGKDVIKNIYNKKIELDKLYPDTYVVVSKGHPAPYSFFMVYSSIKNDIGLFDENFYPAYFEDNDYSYRINLLNKKQYMIEELEIDHVMSGTMKEKERLGIDMQLNHHIPFSKCKEYYIKKWGGEPYQEKFIYPYNNLFLTVKEWRNINE